MANLFVYGTLRHPPILDGLLHRSVPQRPALLRGHRAAPLRGRSYPGLIVDRGSTALGSLIEVRAHELDALDAYEGPDYERLVVQAEVAGDLVAAHTYALLGSAVVDVTPGSWDLDGFVRDHAAAWVRRLA